MTTITSDTLLLHVDRHARITAGPGAGKTYWLAQHTKNVIRRSTKLHSHARIGVISYTNVAADELKQQLEKDADRADTATIHSFLYLNVIKPYLHLITTDDGQPLVNTTLMDGHDEHHVNHQKLEDWLGTIKYRTVLRDADETKRLKETLATIGWKQDDNPTQWTLTVNPPTFIERQLWKPTKNKLTHANLLAYKTLYWADGILDHDDVLYFAARILHKYPIIVDCLSARYPFLFIDEFQDTVPAQTQIVQWLAAKGTTVVVIGDAEQSIFTFAGARPERFRGFNLPDTDEYEIAHNRRSTNQIITLLNHVRADNLVQYGLREDEGQPVGLLVGDVARATQHVKHLLPQGASLLVLARSHVIVQQSQATAAPATQPWDEIDAADNRRKILLHQLFAGIVLARSKRFGAAVATILRGIRHNNGRLKKPFTTSTTRSAQQRRAIAVTLLDAIVHLGPAFDNLTLRAAYDHINTALAASFDDLTLTTISKTGAFATAADNHHCDTLLQSVRLTNSEEVRDARTVHQAKGTERDNVLACLQGRNDAETLAQLNHILNPAPTSDEEQRITYVAISRARDRLFLATPTLTAQQEQRAIQLGITVTRLAP